MSFLTNFRPYIPRKLAVYGQDIWLCDIPWTLPFYNQHVVPAFRSVWAAYNTLDVILEAFDAKGVEFHIFNEFSPGNVAFLRLFSDIDYEVHVASYLIEPDQLRRFVDKFWAETHPTIHWAKEGF